MEIKINKEIRQHRENIFFGLTMRQAMCSVLAVGLAVGAYFLLRNAIGEQAAGWACILAAAPMAVAGFFSYNGMTFEQFIWAVVKTELLCGRPHSFEAENLYETLLVTPEKQKKRGGNPVSKVLRGSDRSDFERFRVPRSVQQSVPIGTIYREGVWKVAGRFSHFATQVQDGQDEPSGAVMGTRRLRFLHPPFCQILFAQRICFVNILKIRLDFLFFEL